MFVCCFFFFQAEDGIRDYDVTGVQTCALPISVLTPLSGIWQRGVYVIRVNNRDRFVIDAATGEDINDGDSFTITNSIGETASVEFDSGYTVAIAKTLGLQVPALGAAIGGITDGQRFSITEDNGLKNIGRA